LGVQHLFDFFFNLGAFGVFILGVIDALLFAPLANDVLVVALTTRHRNFAALYAAMAAIGSLAGVVVLDYISRKGGEAGLEKTMKPKRIEWIKKKVTPRAGWAVALACLMPPPFPFTAVVAGAAALQYSRTKLLTITAITRVIRFGLLAFLAYRFGSLILKVAARPVVRWSIAGLAILSIAGSAWVIWSKWRQRSA
jgi:membrane protein YqaA with SNARE-associated domain